MKRTELFICIACFGIIGCNGQNNSKFDTPITIAGNTFEEKQKKDLSDKVTDLSLTKHNPDPNFRIAAKKAIPGVVHIRTTYANDSRFDSHNQFSEDFWYRFFSEEPLTKPQADASGVIISSDGYIVTNDHVVEDAEDIEITLQDQRSYKAKVVGIDPETDLALLKIKETNLSFIEFGNSDETEVGDWVLAVGNPFNLTSTVTAGIISAKARGINIKGEGEEGGYESYIQTDAAVNRGNSGGALVDFNGKLIGINSIIATPTGSYAGYSFATPVNTVKKIIEDLRVNGKVQRGYLGLVLKNMSAAMSKELNTDITTGVYVDSVLSGGAAMEAELKLKDIITAVDHHEIITSAQMKEIIDRHRPNEKIILTIVRNGKEKQVPLTLKGIDSVVPKTVINKTELLKKLGIKVVELSEKEKKKLKLTYGLRVAEISKGEIYNTTNIKKGFIITKINGKPINSSKTLAKAFENKKSSITLEGLYPGFPAIIYYTFSLE
ncbi:MAG: trypsin-like peptidase domain-containing protein [Bacteroidetes bacterium]|nr:trypsin-like peptidase domain-containing protein [Bacteroidota bacterium]